MRSGMSSADALCQQDQSAIVDGVLTGTQANELVAILGFDAGIIDRQIPSTIDKLQILCLIGKVVKQMEGETNTISAGGAEDANHLVGVLFVQIPHGNILVGIEIALGQILV